LRTSPLGVAIKGATSFSSQENSHFLCARVTVHFLARTSRILLALVFYVVLAQLLI
jgi:hypothetical protein